MKQCIFCHSSKLYTKSPTQLRCATCKRTWSTQKFTRESAILKAFLANVTVNSCAKNLDLNYQSVFQVYEKARLLITSYTQDIYMSQTQTFKEYEEFFYLPQCQHKNSNSSQVRIGFFGMLYDDWVYTLLLPDTFSPHKKFQRDTKLESNTKYFNQHKVTHVKSFEHRLALFWNYFEDYLRPFKGVKKENIIYYLKVAEFQFNYTKEEQSTILKRLWIENM